MIDLNFSFATFKQSIAGLLRLAVESEQMVNRLYQEIIIQLADPNLTDEMRAFQLMRTEATAKLHRENIQAIERLIHMLQESQGKS